MDLLYKTFSADVKAVADTRTIKFLISTDSIDRDGDTMDPKGWDVAAYMKNPVVLWSHDYSGLPVAKAISVEPTQNGLSATAEFPAKGVHPFADTVYELLKGGFLSAASVGFKPIEQTKAMDRDKGYNYARQELLEFSVVPIPANPEALVQMSVSAPQHKGLLKPLVDWSEKFLGEYYGERGVWLPASQVEKTFEAINKAELLKPKTMSTLVVEVDSPIITQAALPPEPVTLELADDLVLELAEEVYDIDPALIAAGVQECYQQIRGHSITEALTQAINYARGRV